MVWDYKIYFLVKIPHYIDHDLNHFSAAAASRNAEQKILMILFIGKAFNLIDKNHLKIQINWSKISKEIYRHLFFYIFGVFVECLIPN